MGGKSDAIYIQHTCLCSGGGTFFSAAKLSHMRLDKAWEEPGDGMLTQHMEIPPEIQGLPKVYIFFTGILISLLPYLIYHKYLL